MGTSSKICVLPDAGQVISTVSVPNAGLTPISAAREPPRRCILQAMSMMRPPSTGLGTAVTLLAIAGIGWIDYATGPTFGMSIFYLLPLLGAGWWLGSRPATLAAVVAGVAWVLADLAPRADGNLLASIWNGATRLGIFLALALLTARVRADRNRLLGLNAQLQELLERETGLARTDAITRLPNSRGFVERLLTETSRCRRTGQPLCVAYLDIDNFKRVNDRHGHSAGDSLLTRIAQTIRDTVRAGDVPARLGGDEFAILFWDVDRGAIEGIARRVIERIADLGRDYPEAFVGASVGIAYFERPPDSAEEILQRADQAMYEAKTSGKGRLVIWSGPSGDRQSAPLGAGPARPSQ